jgi:hypothetical protein
MHGYDWESKTQIERRAALYEAKGPLVLRLFLDVIAP